MTVFKSYFKILKRNLLTLIIHFTVFMVMVIGTFSSISDDDYKFEDNYYNISIINRDAENNDSNQLIQFLEKKYVSKPIEDDYETIVNNLVNGYTDYVLIIDKDLDLTYYGNSENRSSILINMTINQYLNDYNVAKKYVNNPGEIMDEIMLFNTNVDYLNDKFQDPDLRTLSSLYRLLAYPLMAFIMNSIYLGLKNYNRLNIKSRIEVSGVKKKRYSVQLFFAALTSVTFLWIIINTVSLIVFRNVEKSRILLYGLNSFIFSLPITAIGYLLSNNINKDAAVNSAVTLISLGLSFTSGIFVPLDLLSPYDFNKILWSYARHYNGNNRIEYYTKKEKACIIKGQQFAVLQFILTI